MITDKRIIYKGSIPKKNRFFVAILWLDLKILQLLIKPVIKKFFLKNTRNCDFIPGFKSMYGNIFAENAFLADANFIDYAPIYIGNGTHIGFGCTLITASHNPKDFSEIFCDPIWIGKNAFVGTNSMIMQGVRIGDNVTIAAGSVIVKDIPSNCIVGGNPAKIINYI